jgi:hypothetical protein
MNTTTLALPMLGFVVWTRAMLGVGIGLLVSERLPDTQRRAIGAALVAVGAATTIPSLRAVFRGRRRSRRAGSLVESDPRLVGAVRLPRRGDEIG